MAHRLDQPNELPLIHGELEVAHGVGSVEECKGLGAPVEDGTKPRARGIVVHCEDLVEVRHL